MLSCDTFNIGFVIFPCSTHYRASSVKYRMSSGFCVPKVIKIGSCLTKLYENNEKVAFFETRCISAGRPATHLYGLLSPSNGPRRQPNDATHITLMSCQLLYLTFVTTDCWFYGRPFYGIRRVQKPAGHSSSVSLWYQFTDRDAMMLPSVLCHCWLGVGNSIRPVKIE